jgi:hypothetical protein
MTLDRFVDDNRVELIKRARAKAASRCSPQTTLTEVEHGVPIFLAQLSATLKNVAAEGPDKSSSHSPSKTPAIANSAAEHGFTLFKSGFTIEQVVHDYGDVCQAITELAEERRATLSIVEFQTRLDDACGSLIDEATRRGGEDNITAVVARLDGDLPPTARGERISGTYFVIREFQPSQDQMGAR